MLKKIVIMFSLISIASSFYSPVFSENKAYDVNNVVFSPANPLGVKYAESRVNEVAQLINENKLLDARKKLVSLLEWLEDCTKYHTSLYQTLREVDGALAQADVEKDLALKFAVLRDQAKYKMGLVNLKENKKTLAVDNFVNIVRSQPKTDLGFKAYEQLQNMGFTYKVKLQGSQQEIN
jgi:predicted component of type VI protein secretion system